MEVTSEHTTVIESNPNVEQEQNKTKIYEISADYKKSTYQTEQWNNCLKNGKQVRFEVTNYFYWGTFEVELDDKEKEELLKKDSIIINDIPGASCMSLDSGCDYYDEICNKDKYNEEELKEIYKLLYCDEDDEYNSEEEYCLDEDLLEKNGWSMDDTIYGFDTGCVLEDIGGDD